MLHGMTATRDSWRRHGFADLVQHGYQLILIDSRSHGKSDKPHDPSGHGGLTAMAADAVAVLDDAGINRAHVIGYSMGAATGYMLARNAPDRIRSLVLGGGPHTLPEAWVHGITGVLNQGPEALLAMFESSLGELEPGRRDEILQLDTQSVAAAAAASLAEPISEDVFAELSVPCLLYVGADDALAFAQVQRIAELIPNAELHILPGLDHSQAARESDRVLPHVLALFERVDKEDG
jgi:pimeloyl-ACP methyl ester carboxylesterase